MASGNGYEVAKAFVTIVPTMEGSQKTISTELGAITSEASESAGESSGTKFGEKFASALKTSAAVIAGALAAATGAAVATGKAFIDATNDVSELGNTIDKESQKMQMSATSYQEWSFILEHTGASIEGMKNSMKKLTLAAEENNDAFAALGISEEELASMSPEETWNRTVAALQNVTDESTRLELANSLLGKGAIELAPLFNTSAEAVEEMRQQCHELGGVMSDEAVKAAADYQDELQNLKVSLKGLKTSMISQFMPGVTQVMKGLSLVFSGNGGLEEITSGLQEIITQIQAVAPQFFEVAQTIVFSILEGFAPMLPSLVSTIFDILIQAIVTITSMIPQMMPSIIAGIQGICQALFEALPIITAGLFDLIMSLVMWLSEDGNVSSFITGILQLVSQIIDQFSILLPILLPAVIKIIKEVCLALTEPSTVEMLINSVLQLFGAIIVALINAVPELIDLVVGVIMNLGELLASFFDWGGDLVAQGIGAVVEFLKGIGSWLKNAVSNIWTNISSKFTNGINNAKSIVTNGLNNIKNFFSNAFESIRSGIDNKLNAIRDKFHNIFETVKTTVKNGIDKIKSFFDFNWELPHLDMPHFSFSGKFSLDPPSVPRFSVEWYAKAMHEPIMLDGATIFGAANGKLLGGGEAGSEVVIGTDKLLGMMRDAVGGTSNEITINVYAAEGQDVESIANEVALKLEDMTQRRGKVYA